MTTIAHALILSMRSTPCREAPHFPLRADQAVLYSLGFACRARLLAAKRAQARSSGAEHFVPLLLANSIEICSSPIPYYPTVASMAVAVMRCSEKPPSASVPLQFCGQNSPPNAAALHRTNAQLDIKLQRGKRLQPTCRNLLFLPDTTAGLKHWTTRGRTMFTHLADAPGFTKRPGRSENSRRRSHSSAYEPGRTSTAHQRERYVTGRSAPHVPLNPRLRVHKRQGSSIGRARA